MFCTAMCKPAPMVGSQVAPVEMKAVTENQVKEELMMQAQEQKLGSGRSSCRSGRGLSGLALRSTSYNRQHDASDYQSNEKRESQHDTPRRDDPRSARSRDGSMSGVSQHSKHSRGSNVKESKKGSYVGGILDLFSERSSPPGSPFVRRNMSLSQRSTEDTNEHVYSDETYGAYGDGSISSLHNSEDNTTRVRIKEGYEVHPLSHGDRAMETNTRLRLEDGYDHNLLNTTDAILKMNREDLLKLSRLHIDGSSGFKDKETWLKGEEQWITDQIEIEEEARLRQQREEEHWGRQRAKMKEQNDALVRREAIELYCRRHRFPTVNERRTRGCMWQPSQAKGEYALHNAAMNNDIRIVEMLLQEGASTLQRDSAGLTAEQVASKRNRHGSHDEVIRMLQAPSPKFGGHKQIYV
mmetsp:Transcript_103863/g.201301  ORF Transcript_103863/g.201301 Transcript_103863/m.201301 type:complete len:410 (+) Transcript_103863:49-1278(+)